METNKKIPVTIGVIVDGNRRWARAKGLPTLEGHRAGYNRVKELLGWARDAGVKNAIFYVFSTENWKRAPEEVTYLMELLRSIFLENEIAAFRREGVRIRVVGDRTMLAADLQELIAKVENETKDQTKMILALALSYGGRREIIAAVNARLVGDKKEITEEEFAEHLWTAGIPDSDLIIRTGGERRLSNFLPWQTVYSELFFTDTLFPDFSKEEFTRILDDFASRERRFGK